MWPELVDLVDFVVEALSWLIRRFLDVRGL